MPCGPGAILFNLSSGRYTATTPGGTSLVVSCHDASAGANGWRLVATLPGGAAGTYAPQAGATCSPLTLTFRSVVVDCGTIDVSLSETLGPCLPSSSVSPTPSSSVSPVPSSSVSPVSSSPTSLSSLAPIQTDCCPNPIAARLTATVTGGGPTVGSYPLVYRSTPSPGWYYDGAFGSCAAAVGNIFLECVLMQWRITAAGATQVSSQASCEPLLLNFAGINLLACGGDPVSTIEVTL